MSLTVESPEAPAVNCAGDRLGVLFAELAELAGQRNAIDGRIVEIAAQIEGEELAGVTGARSVAALVAWKLGLSSTTAHTITTVARRLQEFPRCAQGLKQGRLSLDQLGVIAAGAGAGSDAHYEQLAGVATVAQLRTAVRLEPRPDPEPAPEVLASITTTSGPGFSRWRITLPPVEAAAFQAALDSHREALIGQWTRDRDTAAPTGACTARDPAGQSGGPPSPAAAPPMPGTVEAFLRLVAAGRDAEADARPHAQRTTVVVHLDAEHHAAALHLGPLLSDAERRYLTCDATGEVWLRRRGQVIGAGRTTRTVSRRLRRALEHRDRTCVVPGCGATRGLHAHHIQHWESGGPTELANLVLLCPHHHRAHHRGAITITGTATTLRVTDTEGRVLGAGSLARPPTTPPPQVPPWTGPLGERADWWWYQPFQPTPPAQPAPPPPGNNTN